MRIQSIVLKVSFLWACGALALAATAQAYEQGSYLVIDVIPTASTKVVETSRIQVEKKTFVLDETAVALRDATQQVSSDFLADITAGKSMTPTFGGVDLNAETTTTPPAAPNTTSFGLGDTSAFGSDRPSLFGE